MKSPPLAELPITENATKDDLLERHLAGLFSDAVLPDTIGASAPHPASTAAGLTLQPQPAPSVSIPEPIRKRQLPRLNWRTGILVAIAVCVVLLASQVAPMVRGTREQERPANTAVPVGAKADAAPDLAATTSAPTARAVSPETPSVLVLPVIGALTRPAPTPTAQSTPIPSVAPAFPATPTSSFSPAATAAAGSTVAATETPKPTPHFTATPIPTEPPTQLVISAIGLDAPITTVGYEQLVVEGQTVTTWAVPDYFAVGWHHTSAPPGQAGNTVLNGHQNIHSGVFRDLSALEQDDEIVVYVGETPHHYRVSEKHLLAEEGQPLAVRVENARLIMPTQDERLTLVTCATDLNRSHRLVVVALPVTPTPTPTSMVQ